MDTRKPGGGKMKKSKSRRYDIKNLLTSRRKDDVGSSMIEQAINGIDVPEKPARCMLTIGGDRSKEQTRSRLCGRRFVNPNGVNSSGANGASTSDANSSDAKTSVPLYPSLDKDKIITVNKMLAKSERTRLHPDGSSTLSVMNLETLQRQNWLDDAVIDYYLEMVRDRNLKENLPSVYVFPCLFFTLYGHKDYDVVKEFTQENDIFNYDMVFFPTLYGIHWRFIYALPKTKTLVAIDSYKNDNTRHMKSLYEYLKNEFVRLGHKDTERIEDWTFVNRTDRPRQKNGFDCGMFLILFAEHIARESTFGFTQINLPYFRYLLSYEIITQKILPHPELEYVEDTSGLETPSSSSTTLLPEKEDDDKPVEE